jgi:hypothetical protein
VLDLIYIPVYIIYDYMFWVVSLVVKFSVSTSKLSYYFYIVNKYVRYTNLHSFYGGRVAQWVRSLDLTTRTSLSPIRRGFAPAYVNYKKGYTRLTAASDKDYQLLAHGRWFSPGTLASFTTKTGRHDIAEILLKVALKHQKSKIKSFFLVKFTYIILYR